MSQTLPIPPAGFDALSIEEQIDYVQSLWDHIAARPEQVPVPDWHKDLLNSRQKAVEEGREKILDWDTVKNSLGSKRA